jgi:hypothetical protein
LAIYRKGRIKMQKKGFPVEYQWTLPLIYTCIKHFISSLVWFTADIKANTVFKNTTLMRLSDPRDSEKEWI